MPLLPQPCHDPILRDLSPVERNRFSKISKEARQAVSSYNKRAFQIEKLLSCYLNTPHEVTEFRKLQYRTGMLISGSSALQFFDCSVYESDLDLYVSFKKGLSVIEFLNSIGYFYQPSANQDVLQTLDNSISGQIHFLPYVGNGLKGVIDFSRDGKKIQLVICLHCPMQIILGFHSTCVMNFISHSHAYSIFPRTTFHNRGSIKLAHTHKMYSREAKANYVKALQKYRERGWSVVDFPSAFDYYRENSEFLIGTRRVGDSACWTIPLSSIDGLTEEEMSPEADGLRNHTWMQNGSYQQDFSLSHKLLTMPKWSSVYVQSAELMFYAQGWEKNTATSSETEAIRLLRSIRAPTRKTPGPSEKIISEILKAPEFPNVPYEYLLSVNAVKELSNYYSCLTASWRPKGVRVMFALKPSGETNKSPRMSTTVIYSIFYIYEEDSYIPKFEGSFPETDDITAKVVDSENFTLYNL
ncbi:hypothetical protein K435DRAFT_755079 [Dendrothele bispora CBS 962.96]|uniref:Uncharacterized protein n=1 Tax=Dendrothele bispora (strain CBS 962.96) TaxID=1314807 RepID=A0A4S8M3C4_DENBC|nr:hypothetical protein K435DRAFT_755079 [Dendrothele bispora CBS 962.96]